MSKIIKNIKMDGVQKLVHFQKKIKKLSKWEPENCSKWRCMGTKRVQKSMSNTRLEKN